ncbi:hypothetical protein, partial [Campylobacter coli]|uniref:hypothetical protein n=2 Tax=Campylobacter coli TaxID=195 RepID=UPI003F7B4C4D
MHYRRGSRGASRSYGRGRPRFRGTTDRKVQRPQKWQAANFQFENILIPEEANDSQNVVTIVAQVPNRIGDSSTVQGRVLEAAARRLEIGGIVWTTTIRTVPFEPTELTNRWAGRQLHAIWAFDRLDSVAQPAAINTFWNLSQSPVTVVAAEDAEKEETNYPSRIVRRYYDTHMFGVQSLGLDAPPSSQEVRNSRWSGSLRLRQFLDDEH